MGIREVFASHTYAHRMNTVFEIVGLSERVNTDPDLKLIALAEDRLQLDALLSFVQRQTYRRFKLQVFIPDELSGASVPANVELAGERPVTAGPTATTSNAPNLVGLVSAQLQYGPDYLQDLVNATLYRPEALGWGKSVEADHFCFDAPTLSHASIWKAEAFSEDWLGATCLAMASPSLFVVDSDQISVPGDLVVRGGDHV